MSAATSPQQSEGADFTQRVSYTFMIGVYLAVNAIRDLYLLIEGPDCTYMKTQYVQGNHDWMSTLTSVSGHHRVANTALHPAQMSGSREESLQATLQRIASHPAVPAVALTSMPMAFITGAEYKWATIYQNFAELLTKGQKLPNFERGGYDKDYVQNTAFGPAASEAARKAATAATADLKANKPYVAGELKDNKGNVVVPAGKIVDNYDVFLETTGYLVEGVIGSAG